MNQKQGRTVLSRFSTYIYYHVTSCSRQASTSGGSKNGKKISEKPFVVKVATSKQNLANIKCQESLKTGKPLELVKNKSP